jgi:hypothetical protein
MAPWSDEAGVQDELTIAQAALSAGVSEEAICRAYMAGRLAFHVAGGPSAARFVCSRQDLVAWLRASTKAPGA